MKSNRTIILLMLIMIFVAMVIGGAAIGILYNTAFEEKRASLIQTVQSQARLIEAISHREIAERPTGALGAIIEQISQAHKNYRSMGRTGEFILARRDGDQIAFLIRNRHFDKDKPASIAVSSNFAEPMRRALNGRSGSVIGLDYRGVKVLAAHEPLAVFDLAIVAKIDLAEVQAPFIRASSYVAIITLAQIALGVGFFFWVGASMARRAEEMTQQFLALFNNSPSAILIKDENLKFLMANEQWHKWFNPDRKDIKGKSTADFLSGDMVSKTERTDKFVIENNRPTLTEIESPSHDGRIFNLLQHKFPIVLPESDRIGVGTIATDITERKRADSIRVQLSNAIKNSPVGMVLWDSDNRFVMCNDFYRELFHYLDDILIPGTKFDDFIRRQAKDGRVKDAEGRIDEFVADRLDAFRQGDAMYDETLQDGRTIRIQRYLLADGSRITYFTDLTDEKARKLALSESEDRFRSVTQSASVAMILAIDDDGIIVNWNLAAERAFQYEESEILGKPLTTIMPERYREAHLMGLKRASQSGLLRHAKTTELHGLRKDGSEFPLELSLGEWRSGETTYFSAVIHDITERKATEAQLRQSQKMEAVGQLSSGIAHDFNNLLMAALGNIELLKDELGENPEAEFHATTAINAILRGADLTNRLLAFSRVQALDPERTDVGKLVNGFQVMVRRTMPASINIDWQISPDLWPVLIDQSQLESAILNLVLNSRDAMQAGGTLTIKCENRQISPVHQINKPDLKAGKYVTISISDTGTGINPGHLNKILDPFFTTKGIGEGSGLGLSMVYGFIIQSEGHIDIESDDGEGTNVTLYLKPDETSGEISEAVKPKQVTASLGAGEKILIIEDEEDVRTITIKQLEKLGYQIIDGGDGMMVLEDCADDHCEFDVDIDLVLSDVVLPNNTSGPELVELVKKCNSSVKVLLMTGYAENNIIRSADGELVYPVLGKPFTKVELANKVSAALHDDA